MARDRLQVCKYYTYENGPCDKRDMNVSHRNECQTCKWYDPRPGDVREKSRRDKLERAEKRDKYDY